MLKENEEKIKELIEKRVYSKAALVCFCIATSKEMKIQVLNACRENGKIEIRGDDLSLLSEKALKALLYSCTTQNEKISHFVVYAKTPQQKLWRYETPYWPS